MTRVAPLLAAVLLLAACTEKPQTTTAKKADEKPWATAASPYGVAGYAGRDQAAWERQMNSRAENQNEYNRTTAR